MWAEIKRSASNLPWRRQISREIESFWCAQDERTQRVEHLNLAFISLRGTEYYGDGNVLWRRWNEPDSSPENFVM